MGLETGNFIDDLVDTNPLGTDPVSEGDDHIRLVKRAVVNGLNGDAATTTLLANLLEVLIAGHDGGTQSAWAVGVLNDTLALLGSVVTQGDTELATFDPAGAAALFNAGIQVLSTTANGALLESPGAVGRLRLKDNNDVEALSVDAAATAVSVIGLVDSIPIRLVAAPAGGGGLVVFQGDADGPAAMYYNGVPMIVTLVNGIEIDGQTSWQTGSGSPEGVVTANPGSIYSDQVSGSTLPLWTKNFSNGNTGWVSCDVSAP